MGGRGQPKKKNKDKKPWRGGDNRFRLGKLPRNVKLVVMATELVEDLSRNAQTQQGKKKKNHFGGVLKEVDPGKQRGPKEHNPGKNGEESEVARNSIVTIRLGWNKQHQGVTPFQGKTKGGGGTAPIKQDALQKESLQSGNHGKSH